MGEGVRQGAATTTASEWAGAPHNLLIYAELQIIQTIRRLLGETGLAPEPHAG